MEATGLSVGKSALNGALNYAKSAIAQEVALQLGVQRDQAFIRDGLEMMLSFLMAAHEERDNHKVVKTWVKQVRDVSYDVEDCLLDQAVRLGKPSRWCFFRTLFHRHHIATRMKELRAKVEDISQRNVRYRLIKDTTGPKSHTGAGSSSIPSATMFSIEEARRQKDDEAKVDLSRLISKGNEDLRVIAVWGTSGVLGQSVLINGAFDDMKRTNKFELYAWIRIVHPFNPLEFLHCVMRQFYSTSFKQAWKTQEKTSIVSQVLKKMSLMEQDDLIDAFFEHVSEKSYLIVLNDMSTIEDWHAIKEYFPDNKKGSLIIVSTEHREVARLCTGQESIVSELNQPSVDQSIFASHIKASQNQTALMETGSSSSETTLFTNNSVRTADEIVENQFVGNSEKIARKSFNRLGTMACALEESQLVGREKEKSELINLISNQDYREIMVISVWGMGGLGKTTLVKEVYQSQELSGLFAKCACVTIMRPFVLNEVLKSLAMQLREESSKKKKSKPKPLTEELGELTITEELGELTKGKRCLIVLDDLSSSAEWDMIIQSLPKMDSASRIVITTREENIAKHCSEKQESIYKLGDLNFMDALELFTKKVFKEAINSDQHPALMEEAKSIVKKCNGLPLAIVTIGGFLAKQPKTPMQWRKLSEHISAELEMNPELGIIKGILMKSYDGLPFHLKSCFLYLSIFPEDYSISRRRLVHRWNAEGYSTEVRGKSMEEIADSYFVELIERSMVLPSKKSGSSIGSRKGISSCKLHDLMREISISKSMKENLVFRMEEGCSLNTQGTIRHLAISSNWEGDQNEFESTVDLSRIRSLTVFGSWKPFYISDKMKLLRVLDLESTSDLQDHHLEPIGKLLHLKYLSLRGCTSVFHLPESVGNLKQLETIDVIDTQIMRMPQAITKLRKLQYIRARVSYVFAGGMSYNEFVESLFPKGMRSKPCVWTRMLMSFCLSCCSPESREYALETEGANLNDVCTFFCCTVFPFLARLADPFGVTLPRGLRKLKALHTLGMVNIAPGKGILQEIKRLTRLRKLSVTGINKKNCQEFCSTLAHLSSLESLSVHSKEEEGLRDCLDSLRTPLENLQSLKLCGSLGKLPEWVTMGLQNLVKLKLERTSLTELDGTMQVLGKLPNLAILHLLDFSFNAEGPAHFTCRGEAFPSLTALELAYPEIELVQFEAGAVPKLELLLCQAGITLSGLSSLLNLKEVMLNKRYLPSFVELVSDVQNQLSRHPNKPVMKFV